MNRKSNNIIPLKKSTEIQIKNPNSNFNNNIEDAAKVIELMRFNKINVKNAFDINVNFIESITNMINKNEESAWQKASASLDATAKIYGFRVDSVHTEAFKFLGGLNRNKDNEKNNNIEIENENDENKKKENKIRKGQNTLETNLKKLNLTKYDIEIDVDPLFSVMTSKFNESSAKGLLLNTIPLDENLNYILESKKIEEKINFENENLEQKENNSNLNEEESLSGVGSLNSIGVKNSQKIDDVIKLAENLKEKKNSQKIKMVCSNNFDSTQDEIKNILKKFIIDNNVDDFVKLQLCPELLIFREKTKIDNEDLNKTFINIFKNEINFADKNNYNSQLYDNNSENNENKNFFDDNAIIEDERENIEPYENENQLEELPENNNSINSQNEIININLQESVGQITMTLSTLNTNENSFSGYRYEDLIDHASQFGSGNMDNLPQFSNFAKNFGKIDKNGIFNRNSIFGFTNKKEIIGKKTKQEKLFIFNKENEMDINDLFFDSRSKINLKTQLYENCNIYENKRKKKCFYNYNKFSLFKLFVINNKTIFNKDIDNDVNIEQQEKNLLENTNNKNNDIGEYDGGAPEIEGYDRENEEISSEFLQHEKKVEKNFGKLYRRFDIRSLKAKILTSYENVKSKEKIDFKDIVINMSKNMKEEEVFSISTPTCFVCMLHLCNEKNLFIEQSDMSTFYIETDNDGKKSSKDTRNWGSENEKMNIVKNKRISNSIIIKNGIKNGKIYKNDENVNNNNNVKINNEKQNNQKDDYEIDLDED